MFFAWETIYMTNNLEEFASIRGRLLDNGIKTKTKIDGNSLGDRGRGRGMPRMSTGSNMVNNYEILVKKEDVHKANQVIHHPR